MKGARKCNGVEEMERFIKAGFKVDAENGLYVMKKYGALICNIAKKELRDTSLEYTFLGKYIKDGYKILFGPPAPNGFAEISDKLVGIYVQNYLEIINFDKKMEAERVESQALNNMLHKETLVSLSEYEEVGATELFVTNFDIMQVS